MTITEIKALIAQDKIDETIDSIINGLDTLDDSEKNDLILLASRYKSYKKKKIGGFENETEINRLRADLLEYLGAIENKRRIVKDWAEKDKIEKIAKNDALATISKFKGLRRKILDSETFDEKKISKLVDQLEEIQEKVIELDELSRGFFITSSTRIKYNNFIRYLFETMRLESVQQSIEKLDYKIAYLKFMRVFVPIIATIALIAALINEAIK